MCTRCPSILSLEVDVSVEEPVVWLSTKADFETKIECGLQKVSVNIQEITDSLALSGVVTEKPIYIKVKRKSGPTLTLMDLPGITNISPNQKDIEEVTVALTNKHIKNESMIVLCVIPGWEDFNNPSEGTALGDGSRPRGATYKWCGHKSGCAACRVRYLA